MTLPFNISCFFIIFKVIPYEIDIKLVKNRYNKIKYKFNVILLKKIQKNINQVLASRFKLSEKL